MNSLARHELTIDAAKLAFREKIRNVYKTKVGKLYFLLDFPRVVLVTIVTTESSVS